MVSVKTLHGSAQLLLDATSGVTDITERMHRTIARDANPLYRLFDIAGLPKIEQRRHITHRVIQSASYGMTQGLHYSFSRFSRSGGQSHSPQSVGVVAALNGVCGDHLEASHNPLAIKMNFRNSLGEKVQPGADKLNTLVPDASPRIVVLVHGLCLSHEYWTGHDEGNLGTELQRASGFTPLYLNYNTGCHISCNGRELREQLQILVKTWPVEVKELTLVGHSMGGLAIRSACSYGDELNLPWPMLLRNALYLGPTHQCWYQGRAG